MPLSEIMAELHRDHANMARLLQILERQVQTYRQGDQPDWDLVSAIVAYFSDYPDLCHHPKEDVIASKMLETDPDRAQAVIGLVAKHEELAVLLRNFDEAVRLILSDAELPRDYFPQVAGKFIDSQKRHIELEEADFFPLAAEMLSEDDLAELKTKLPRVRDPLFGEDVEERFETLFQIILDWENRADQAT